MQSYVLLSLICVALATLAAGWITRDTLTALWREPMLKRAVLIIESDDWGAGPPEQSEWLDRIAAALDAYADRDGRKPVMTLGLVLGVANCGRMVADGCERYVRKSICDLTLRPVLAAIQRGTASGVFAPQLHGAEHYWPTTLLAAARSDARVAVWLTASAVPKTEGLPAALQSRWIDASELPSKPLAESEIRAAALAEADEFRRIFGKDPAVAVPPTFIWNDVVEAGWVQGGVQFVVTPGRRYEARGADGQPSVGGPALRNGDQGVASITYLVRNDYFEPARGHKAERALEALTAKTRLGRPTLLEMHRENFLGDRRVAEAAIDELERLFALALIAFPTLVYLSTEELGLRMCRGDPCLVERRIGARLHIWLRRLWHVGRLRKLACATGAVIPGGLLYAVMCAVAPGKKDS